MRKTLGLCFLALTLTAATAHAQGLFLEKGEPGTSAAVGGAAIGTGWSASVVPSYTYRACLTWESTLPGMGTTTATAMRASSQAIGAMPFVNVYFIRAGDDTAKIALQCRYRALSGSRSESSWAMVGAQS